MGRVRCGLRPGNRRFQPRSAVTLRRYQQHAHDDAAADAVHFCKPCRWRSFIIATTVAKIAISALPLMNAIVSSNFRDQDIGFGSNDTALSFKIYHGIADNSAHPA